MSKTNKALPQPRESIQSNLVSPIRRKKTMIKIEVVWIRCHVILMRSSALIVQKWATMPTIIQSQKTCFGLGNLFVGD